MGIEGLQFNQAPAVDHIEEATPEQAKTQPEEEVLDERLKGLAMKAGEAYEKLLDYKKRADLIFENDQENTEKPSDFNYLVSRLGSGDSNGFWQAIFGGEDLLGEVEKLAEGQLSLLDLDIESLEIFIDASESVAEFIDGLPEAGYGPKASALIADFEEITKEMPASILAENAEVYEEK